jgi:energy-coupling factor transporter ATP-binding protein EcfA2
VTADPAVAVEVVGLKRSYRAGKGVLLRRSREIEALRGITFSIERGELFGLLGPNGAGKTTTIKVLTTLLLPSAGTARVLGFDASRRCGGPKPTTPVRYDCLIPAEAERTRDRIETTRYSRDAEGAERVELHVSAARPRRLGPHVVDAGGVIEHDPEHGRLGIDRDRAAV